MIRITALNEAANIDNNEECNNVLTKEAQVSNFTEFGINLNNLAKCLTKNLFTGTSSLK